MSSHQPPGEVSSPPGGSSGPGVIPEPLIADIIRQVPPPIATFLLTSCGQIPSIVAQQRKTRANTLQLCDGLPPGGHARLRAALPGVSLVQVVHVTGEEAVGIAVAVRQTSMPSCLTPTTRQLR